MKKILLSVFFILILSVSIRAEYSDTITETAYSTTDTIQINKIIFVEITPQDSFIWDTAVNITMTFDNYIINSDSYVIYINGALQFDSAVIDTDIITKEIEILKNVENTITVYTFYNGQITDSATINFYNITQTAYSTTDTITINKVINITIANYESYTIDTTANITITFDNYLINSDSYSVIVNGDTQIDRTLIDTDIITVEIELLENTNNQITVLTDFGSETINIIHATQTAYSIADTIIINASTPSFIFDLINYVSDYSRFKKIWELYPQLSGVSGFKFWHELATLENDNYYREPNLPYLKFKRLAAKYK